MSRPGLALPVTAAVLLLACATQSQTKRSTYCEEITNNDADFGQCLRGNYPRGRKKALAAAEADNARRESKNDVQKRVAVLPLDTRAAKARLSDDSREKFDDALRETVAAAVNKSKWTVISAEDTVAGYTDDPPAKCVALPCQLAVAKGIKADVIVTGAVMVRAPKLVAAVTLVDVNSGETIGSFRVDGKNASALTTVLQKKAAEMVAASDLAGPAQDDADSEDQTAPAANGPQKKRAAEPTEAEPAPPEASDPGESTSTTRRRHPAQTADPGETPAAE